MSIEQNVGTLGSPQNKALERQVVENTDAIAILQEQGSALPESNETRLDTVEPKVTTLESEMDQAQADISALELSDAGQDASIASLVAGQSAQDSAIASNASGIANNASGIALNASGVSANDLAITEEHTKNAEQDNRLDIIDLDQATQDTAIAQNASDISAIETEQTTQSANIAQNALDIVSNRADIDQNTTDIQNLTAGATEKITSFDSTNPQLADIYITYAKAFALNAVYFIVLTGTLDGSGMTISKDSGVTKLPVRDELGAQVTGSDYNNNDSIFVRYNGTDFTMLTPQSQVSIETRLGNAEDAIDALELADTTQNTAITQNTLNIAQNTSDITTKAIKPTNEGTATDGQVLTSNGDGTSTYEDLVTGGAVLLLDTDVSTSLDLTPYKYKHFNIYLVYKSGIYTSYGSSPVGITTVFTKLKNLAYSAPTSITYIYLPIVNNSSGGDNRIATLTVSDNWFHLKSDAMDMGTQSTSLVSEYMKDVDLTIDGFQTGFYVYGKELT